MVSLGRHHLVEAMKPFRAAQDELSVNVVFAYSVLNSDDPLMDSCEKRKRRESLFFFFFFLFFSKNCTHTHTPTFRAAITSLTQCAEKD